MSKDPAISHLFWIGSGSGFIPGVPARDLEATDLERIVYRRTVGEREDRHGGHAPGDAEYPDAHRAVVDSLLHSGLYTTTVKPPEPEE